MNYSVVGNSDLQVSRIGLGCMSLTENNTDYTKLLQQAVEMGINFFDTADLYQQGQNEIIVGKALKENRKKIIIATKVGNQIKTDGSGGWDWNPRKEYIIKAVNDSLQRLQTDYIDLYQLHGGTMEDPIHEVIEAFELLKQQGKIRFYGISSIRPNVIRAYACRANICSVMMQYSLLDRRPEESCLAFLTNKNIGVLARGTLAGGLLVNKPAATYLNYTATSVAKAATAIYSLSNNNRNNTQTALQFVLQQPAIASAIVGIRTMEQLNEAVKSINTTTLTDNEINVLHNTLPLNYYIQHR